MYYPATYPEDLTRLSKLLKAWPCEKDPALPWTWGFRTPAGVPVRLALITPREGGMASLVALDMRDNSRFDLSTLPEPPPADPPPAPFKSAAMEAPWQDTTAIQLELLREIVNLLGQIRDDLHQRLAP